MVATIITTEDLREFKMKLLDDIKQLLNNQSGHTFKKWLKSREVIELIEDEPFPTYSKPNLWIGYNAFNWMLHYTLKKSFSQQKKLDRVLFDEIYEIV